MWLLGVALSLLVPVAMANGFALSRMWHWFVVPLGVPEIGVAWAYGLSLFRLFFVKPADPKVTVEEMFRAAWREISNAVVMLGLAYVTHLLIR